MISFTVITPVFNREDCIGRCMESVVGQNYPAVEYWIVNDGSTDKTDSIVETYISQYPCIKYHAFEKNKGVNAARNYAIQNSTGDFIIFLDSDDVFVNDTLKIINQTILTHPGYKHYLFAQNDRMSYYNQHPLLKNENAELTFADFLTGKAGGDFLHVMSSSLLRSFPFHEQLRIYEGLNFLRIFKAGKKQYFTKQILVERERGRADSVTKEYYLQNKDALNKQYESNKEDLLLFETDYICFNAHERLQSLTRRIFTLGVALGKYDVNKELLANPNVKIPIFIKIVNYLRIGFVLRISIYAYSGLKNLFKSRLI